MPRAFLVKKKQRPPPDPDIRAGAPATVPASFTPMAPCSIPALPRGPNTTPFSPLGPLFPNSPFGRTDLQRRTKTMCFSMKRKESEGAKPALVEIEQAAEGRGRGPCAPVDLNGGKVANDCDDGRRFSLLRDSSPRAKRPRQCSADNIIADVTYDVDVSSHVSRGSWQEICSDATRSSADVIPPGTEIDSTKVPGEIGLTSQPACVNPRIGDSNSFIYSHRGAPGGLNAPVAPWNPGEPRPCTAPVDGFLETRPRTGFKDTLIVDDRSVCVTGLQSTCDQVKTANSRSVSVPVRSVPFSLPRATSDKAVALKSPLIEVPYALPPSLITSLQSSSSVVNSVAQITSSSNTYLINNSGGYNPGVNRQTVSGHSLPPIFLSALAKSSPNCLPYFRPVLFAPQYRYDRTKHESSRNESSRYESSRYESSFYESSRRREAQLASALFYSRGTHDYLQAANSIMTAQAVLGGPRGGGGYAAPLPPGGAWTLQRTKLSCSRPSPTNSPDTPYPMYLPPPAGGLFSPYQGATLPPSVLDRFYFTSHSTPEAAKRHQGSACHVDGNQTERHGGVVEGRTEMDERKGRLERRSSSEDEASDGPPQRDQQLTAQSQQLELQHSHEQKHLHHQKKHHRQLEQQKQVEMKSATDLPLSHSLSNRMTLENHLPVQQQAALSPSNASVPFQVDLHQRSSIELQDNVNKSGGDKMNQLERRSNPSTLPERQPFVINPGNEENRSNNPPSESDDPPKPGRRLDPPPRFECEACLKSYSTFNGLSKHKEFHCATFVRKQFSCPHCATTPPRTYTSLGALKMHVRTHTLPCRCALCGKAFSRPWLLQGHLRTHTGEKPFDCAHCARAFADRSNLRAHLQTHCEVKKYSCAQCARTFSRMSLLLKHREGGGCCKIAAAAKVN